MFSIVLVIKSNTHHSDGNGDAHNNIRRFLEIGLTSYERFLDVKSVAEFVVVAPPTDLERLRGALMERCPSWPWRFIDENQVVARGIPGGWAKQQTAKLAISTIITTPTYLIIDDDVFLTRPLGEKDLYASDGKLRINTMDSPDFPFFAIWSARVLGMDYEMVQDFPYHMAITPEVFVTDVAKELVAYLEKRHGKTQVKGGGAGGGWQAYLANAKFTEYWCYWIFLIHTNRVATYYTLPGVKDGKMYDHVVSGPEHNLKERVAAAFGAGDHLFSFVQTSQAYTNTEVAAVVLPYLAA